MALDCGSFHQVLPAVAAIVGAIVGGGIGFLTATYSIYRSARAAAASKLRGAFIPELVAMKFDHSNNGFDADHILRTAFPRHAQAVEEYRFYVRRGKRAAYEQAWRDYYEVGGSVRFFDYMMGSDPQGCFERRVDGILSFTR